MKKILSILSVLSLTTLSVAKTVSCDDPNQIVIGFSRSNDGEYQAFLKVIDKFREEHPDTKVKLRQFTDYVQEMTAMIAVGNVPDIVLVPTYNLNMLLSSGALKPLDFIDMTKYNYSLVEPFTAKTGSRKGEMIPTGKLKDVNASDESKFIFESNGDDFEIEPSLENKKINDMGYSVYALPKDASSLATFINTDMETNNAQNVLDYFDNNELTYADIFKHSFKDEEGFTVGENILLSRDLGILSLVGETKNDNLLDEMINNPDYAATLWGNKYQYLNTTLFDRNKGTENHGTWNATQVAQGLWTGALFASYKADVVLEGNWAISSVEMSRSKDSFQVRSLPKANKFTYDSQSKSIKAEGELKPVSMIYTNGWGLTRNAKPKANEVLEFLVGDVGNEIWTRETKMISANIDVLKKQLDMYEEDERLSTFLSETTSATPEQVGDFYMALLSEWEDWTAGIYNFEINTTTFEQFYSSFKEMLKRVKQNREE